MNVHAATSDHIGPDDPVSHAESAGPYATLCNALDRYLARLQS